MVCHVVIIGCRSILKKSIDPTKDRLPEKAEAVRRMSHLQDFFIQAAAN